MIKLIKFASTEIRNGLFSPSGNSTAAQFVDGAGAVRAAYESDKELQAICWVSLICRLFDKNTVYPFYFQLFRANIRGTKECQGLDGSKKSVPKKEDETTIFY